LTTERTTDRHVALITGIVSKGSNVPFASMLRPLTRDSATSGHFHAAIFAYRPLARGDLKLREAVTSLMNTDSAKALLHLLCDDRPFEGIGQSELFRGACWVGRVAETPAQPT
jgi:hypothetical protein